MLTKDNAIKKESYSLVDIMKFLLCLCVIALHAKALDFLPTNVQYFIEKLIFRVAVPYFFVASGFFLGRKLKMVDNSWQTIRNYCTRLLKPFIVFSIINIIQELISNWGNLGQSCIEILQHIIFYPYGALWYVQASIIGALLLYPFIKKNKILLALFVGGFLYVFALLANNYYFVVRDGFFGDCVEKYLSLCISGRNGLFVGFFFLALGIMSEQIYSKFKDKSNKFLICLSVFTVLYIAEVYLIWKFALPFVKDDGALYISHLLFIPALFLTTVAYSKNIVIKKSVTYRNLSTGMYFLHRPILWFVNMFYALLNRIFNIGFMQSLVMFLNRGFVIFIITFGVSLGICLIVYKSKKEPFNFLLK